MKKILCSIALLIAMAAFQPAISQNKSVIEKEVKALAEELRRAYDTKIGRAHV